MNYVSDLFKQHTNQFYQKIWHNEITNGIGQLNKGDAGNGLGHKDNSIDVFRLIRYNVILTQLL